MNPAYLFRILFLVVATVFGNAVIAADGADAIKARMNQRLPTIDALKERRIRPYFQPIYELTTHEISGFEALARWEHPTRGLISPAAFLPIVDDLGLVIRLRSMMSASLIWRNRMRRIISPVANSCACYKTGVSPFPASFCIIRAGGNSQQPFRS